MDTSEKEKVGLKKAKTTITKNISRLDEMRPARIDGGRSRLSITLPAGYPADFTGPVEECAQEERESDRNPTRALYTNQPLGSLQPIAPIASPLPPGEYTMTWDPGQNSYSVTIPGEGVPPSNESQTAMGNIISSIEAGGYRNYPDQVNVFLMFLDLYIQLSDNTVLHNNSQVIINTIRDTLRYQTFMGTVLQIESLGIPLIDFHNFIARHCQRYGMRLMRDYYPTEPPAF